MDLTIQRVLQEAVQGAVEKYDAMWGTGVVMDPWTGDVLAMCSVPTFDPNQYNTTMPEDMLNRAICSPYEPGSVFKPIMASSAVQEGVMDYDTVVDCGNGTYFAERGGRISDHGHAYGRISLRMGVIKSSNIMMAHVGERLGNRKQHEILYRWGFGEKTERRAARREPGHRPRPGQMGRLLDASRVPFGQEIGATALQLTSAFSAMANGGLLMKPRLVRAVTDEQGRIIWEVPPQVVRRVLSPDVAAETLSVLREVVTIGTGKRARLDGYTSWGKTGTAQVPGPGGYMEGRLHCQFHRRRPGQTARRSLSHLDPPT